MSKYIALWNYLKNFNEKEVILNFADIKDICGFEIDHSFLKAKKELLDYGYEVIKISLKEKMILFRKIS